MRIMLFSVQLLHELIDSFQQVAGDFETDRSGCGQIDGQM
jgi:hypothetical protein